MKNPAQKSLLIGVGFLSVLIVSGVIGLVWENSRYNEILDSYTQLQRQAKKYERIKERHSIASSQETFDFLKHHPKLLKEEKRGGNYVFEFDNLSASEFDRITNKILNSMLTVKKLSLKKNGSSKGSISVEIES